MPQFFSFFSWFLLSPNWFVRSSDFSKFHTHLAKKWSLVHGFGCSFTMERMHETSVISGTNRRWSSSMTRIWWPNSYKLVIKYYSSSQKAQADARKTKAKMSGTYIISAICSNGAVEITESAPNSTPLIVNGHRLFFSTTTTCKYTRQVQYS